MRNGAGANTPGWNIRVVPNRFPALGIEGDLDREGEGLFDKMNGIGAQRSESKRWTTWPRWPRWRRAQVEDVLVGLPRLQHARFKK